MLTQKPLTFMVLTWALGFGLSASAQSKKEVPKSVKPSVASSEKNPVRSGPTATPDKVDVSDIENKYWAPKDTDFSVVQNRTFAKEKRFSASLLYGSILNEGFVDGNAVNVSANYFMSERYGIQLEYMNVSLRDSQATQQVFAKGGSPDYGLVKSYYGIGFNWVPFYAKMSFLGSKIIYFDMAFTPVLGLTQYDAQVQTGAQPKSGVTLGLDITQWYFLNKNFAVRVDLKNRWYQEDVLKFYTGDGLSTGEKIKTQFQDNTYFLIGGTYFF